MPSKGYHERQMANIKLVYKYMLERRAIVDGYKYHKEQGVYIVWLSYWNNYGYIRKSSVILEARQ